MRAKFWLRFYMLINYVKVLKDMVLFWIIHFGIFIVSLFLVVWGWGSGVEYVGMSLWLLLIFISFILVVSSLVKGDDEEWAERVWLLSSIERIKFIKWIHEYKFKNGSCFKFNKSLGSEDSGVQLIYSIVDTRAVYFLIFKSSIENGEEIEFNCVGYNGDSMKLDDRVVFVDEFGIVNYNKIKKYLKQKIR